MSVHGGNEAVCDILWQVLSPSVLVQSVAYRAESVFKHVDAPPSKAVAFDPESDPVPVQGVMMLCWSLCMLLCGYG